MAHSPAGFRRRLLGALICCVACVFSLAACKSKPAAPLHSPEAASPVVATTQIAGGTIRLHIDGPPPRVSIDAIMKWITTGGHAVVSVFGHYPVREVDIILRTGGEGEIGDARTFPDRRIVVDFGNDVTPRFLNQDWVITHEMFHLAFPVMGEPYTWMNEGLSTYLEPIARARVGNMTAEQVWRETLANMPDALPDLKKNDTGLNSEPAQTRERIYWGGCMFWLRADVQIRERTAGRKSLDDVLRAVLSEGGDVSESWPMERVLTAGDRATGTNVLHELYDQLAVHPGAADLNDLWKRLGIVQRGRRITFDDTAPLAPIRKAITAPPATPAP